MSSWGDSWGDAWGDSWGSIGIGVSIDAALLSSLTTLYSPEIQVSHEASLDVLEIETWLPNYNVIIDSVTTVNLITILTNPLTSSQDIETVVNADLLVSLTNPHAPLVSLGATVVADLLHNETVLREVLASISTEAVAQLTSVVTNPLTPGHETEMVLLPDPISTVAILHDPTLALGYVNFMMALSSETDLPDLTVSIDTLNDVGLVSVLTGLQAAAAVVSTELDLTSLSAVAELLPGSIDLDMSIAMLTLQVYTELQIAGSPVVSVDVYRKAIKTIKQTTKAMNVRRGYIKGKKLIP